MKKTTFNTIAHGEMGYQASGVPDDHPMIRCLDNARIYAESGEDILIQGPTGAGKELLARIIHKASSRKDQPFAIYDCSSAITGDPTLIESELFGHIKGAFTGADTNRVGIIKKAKNGVLFFDEIDKAPPELHNKLLRLQQERTYRVLGTNETEECKAQFLFASVADLDSLAKGGAFNRDFLARIKQFRLRLPALMDRKHDIIPILLWVLSDCRFSEKGIKYISYNVYDFLHSYLWPDNIRELKGVLRKLVLFTPELKSPDTITFEAVKRVFDPTEMSAREFAEHCGCEYCDSWDNGIDTVGMDDWNWIIEEQWQAFQRIYNNVFVGKYIIDKTFPQICSSGDPEQESFIPEVVNRLMKIRNKKFNEGRRRGYFEDVRLRTVRLRDSRKAERRFRTTLYDPDIHHFDDRPMFDWLVDEVVWGRVSNEKLVFFDHADTRILIDLKKLFREYAPHIFSANTVADRLRSAGFGDPEITEIIGSPVNAAVVASRIIGQPLSQDKIDLIRQTYDECGNIMKTARLTGCSRNTVRGYIRVKEPKTDS